MADRRTDDTPLAPRRSLGASGGSREGTHAGTRPGSPERSAGGEGDRDTAVTRSQPASPSPNPSASQTGSRAAGQPATRASDRADKSARSDSRSGRPSAGTARPTAAKSRTRKARLRLTHVDPWSVMKTAFLLSVAFGIVTVIAVSVVWSVLGAAGVWAAINQTVAEVIGGDTGDAFDIENYVGTNRVMGFTMIVAVVDVILITAIATLGAFLYNLSATLLGGVEVTLAEDER